MKLFSKNSPAQLTLGAAMLALVGKETVSAEEAEAANGELAGAGVTGAQLITEAAFKELTDQASAGDEAGKARDKAAADLKAVTDALAAAGAADVAALVAQRDEARQKAEEYGAQPGAMGTTAAKEKPDVSEEGGDANEKLVAELHEKMLRG